MSELAPLLTGVDLGYPILGGGEECIETPFGGGIRAVKPKYTTSFDAGGCPLG